MIHLILGGARSGKSNFAEQWCLEHVKTNVNFQSLVYIATATAFDEEMNNRISHHQQSRAKVWKLIECPLNLSEQLISISNNKTNSVYLIDCLTLWLNNVIFSLENLSTLTSKKLALENNLHQLTESILLASKQGSTITLVANEVGLGVIPMGEETRLFVDYAGWLNQSIARISNTVTLVTAGIPLSLKGKKND